MHTGYAESRVGGGTGYSPFQMRCVAAFAALDNHRESSPPVTTGGYSLPPHTRLKIVNWLAIENGHCHVRNDPIREDGPNPRLV